VSCLPVLDDQQSGGVWWQVQTDPVIGDQPDVVRAGQEGDATIPPAP
jgi:hypothetical protein